MKDLKRASIVVAVLVGTSGAGSLVSVGCGSTPTGVVNTDASTDATKDSNAQEGGQKDVTPKPDGTSDAGSDARHDTGVDGSPAPDTGVDAEPDVVVDAGRDGIADAGRDVKALEAYPNQVTTAYCERWFQCCGSQPSIFSVKSCVADLEGAGTAGAISNVGNAVTTSGHINFNASAASNCLAIIASLDCNTITAQQNLALINACAAPMQGTLAVGQTGCKSAWDCVQPAYCKPGADAGTCSALLGLNQPCGDPIFSQDCTALGNVPGAFCGPALSEAPTCLAAEGDGGACSEPIQCLSTICNGSNCVSVSSSFGLADGGAAGGSSCYWYPPVDGGADGG